MSDDPTIPLKDDAPDWEKASNLPVVQTLMRLSYIAGMERCAEWHEKEADEIDFNHPDYFRGESSVHKKSTATIRQLIEKEKNNG